MANVPPLARAVLVLMGFNITNANLNEKLFQNESQATKCNKSIRLLPQELKNTMELLAQF
jgi:hypothetical protein